MKSLVVLLSLLCMSIGSLFASAASLNHAKDEKNVQEQQTLAIIKPDAVAKNHIGEIIARFEASGLRVSAIKMVKLNKAQAEQFYAVHRDRPFFNDLAEFMSSGPILAVVLSGKDAVVKNRATMGATDPAQAASGTLRSDFGASVQCNAVHGSDSPLSAATEIAFFFSPSELFRQ